MSAAIYVQINIIPIIVLIIMRLNTPKIFTYTWRSRVLRFIIVLLAGIIVINMCTWVLDGSIKPYASALLWFTNTLYSGSVCFAAFLWYLYVYDMVVNGVGQTGRKAAVWSVPLLVLLAVLASNPWHRLLFYMDSHNHYVRGPYFVLQVLIPVGYLTPASALAHRQIRLEYLPEKKKEFQMLASFILLPVLGSILQLAFFGTDLIWPFTAASLLLIYTNVQREQVTRDSLTGLNNRRRLDQYLQIMDERLEDKENWYFILMDINKFKSINDAYGHVTGDEVLREVSDRIKVVFGAEQAFLARYGGDEFVIILKSNTPEEAMDTIRRLQESVAGIRWGGGKPWEITLSAGCVKYNADSMKSTRDAVALADKRMYQEKKRTK